MANTTKKMTTKSSNSLFDRLKKSSSNLLNQMETEVKNEDVKGEKNFYTPKVNDKGVNTVRGRFLPFINDEDETRTYLKVSSHFFKGKTNKTFYEICPKTYGKDKECPVCEENYAMDYESNKQRYSERKKKNNYYANFYIFEDLNNPDNNGNVVLYKFGVKVFDKIKNKMFPELASETKIQPFDIFDGADFIIKVKKTKDGKNEFMNYDDSYFAQQSPFLDGDETKIEEILSELIDLNIICTPDKVKSYEELKEKLQRVDSVGTMEKGNHNHNDLPIDDDDDDLDDLDDKGTTDENDLNADDILSELKDELPF